MAFSGYDDLDSELGQRLQALLAASPYEFTPISGKRTPERQAQLWRNAVKKYGSESAARKWVAPPRGTRLANGEIAKGSRHERGGAVDLSLDGKSLATDPKAAAWLRANAPKYGLSVPLSNEDWHVELAGSRTGSAPAAAQGTSARANRPTRNNNPGNITDGSFAKSQPGYVGTDGRFAVFADATSGFSALQKLLSGPAYRNLTIAQATTKYAPPGDGNDTAAYIKSLERGVGVSSSTRVQDLTPAQFAAYTQTISRIEGWQGGAAGPTSNVGAASVDAVLASSRRPLNFPPPLPASVLNPTSEVSVPTLAERMAEARGVYSAPRIGSGNDAIATLAARRVKTLNESIAGLDKATSQARARLLAQGDYASGRIEAIRDRMDPRFAASNAQLAAFGNASAGAIAGTQGALGAGAAADGTATADLGQAFGENAGATGQLSALDNAYAGAVRGNTSSLLDEIAGPGTDAITQAGLASLELNDVAAQYDLRRRSSEAQDKDAADIIRLYEEARINAELGRPQQELAALSAINDYYNNQRRFGIDEQQLALTERGQNIQNSQFGQGLVLDQGRLANDTRQTDASIVDAAAGRRLREQEIGISQDRLGFDREQLDAQTAEQRIRREEATADARTKAEQAKLEADPAGLGYTPYSTGEKTRYPLMPVVVEQIWKLNRDGQRFTEQLPPEARTFSVESVRTVAVIGGKVATFNPEDLAGWASIQGVTSEAEVRRVAETHYRQVAGTNAPSGYTAKEKADFARKFAKDNADETVKQWRLATAYSLTNSNNQPESFSANEVTYINRYLAALSAQENTQNTITGAVAGAGSAPVRVAVAGAKNAKAPVRYPVSPAVRAATLGVKQPRLG